MNIHEILLQDVIIYAIVSSLINSMKQSLEEFNICSVGSDNYRTPEFIAVFTGACNRSLYTASDSCSFPDIQFL
jgi:hypothetical protein